MKIQFGHTPSQPVRKPVGVTTQVSDHVTEARKQVQTVADWGARTAILELADAVAKINACV